MIFSFIIKGQIINERNHNNTNELFTNLYRLIPSLGGFYEHCRVNNINNNNNNINDETSEISEYNNKDIFSPHKHVCQAKVCYDSLSQDWIVWWSCCGLAQVRCCCCCCFIKNNLQLFLILEFKCFCY